MSKNEHPTDRINPAASDPAANPTQAHAETASTETIAAATTSATAPRFSMALEALDAFIKSYRVPEQQARRMRSNLKRIAAAAEVNVESLPLDPSALKPLLLRARPSSLRVNRKTWVNCISTLNRLGRWAGWIDDNVLLGDISASWQAALDRIPPPRWRRQRLLGLARYMTKLGIEPDVLNVDHLRGYRAELERRRYTTSASSHVASARTEWNRLADLSGGTYRRLPQMRDDPHKYSLPDDQFDPTFLADLAKWKKHVGEPSLFEHRFRRASPRTIADRTNIFRRLATLLIQNGRPVTSLADLVEVGNVKVALAAFHARSGNRWTRHARAMATGVMSLAKQYVSPPEAEIQELRKVVNAVKPPPDGLGARVEKRLQVLRDPRKRREFYELPMRLMWMASRMPEKVHGARLYMYAAILLVAQDKLLRRANIVNLHLDDHLRFDRRGKPIAIVVQWNETKGRQPAEREVTGEFAEHLHRYITEYRPLLCADPSNRWLFPGKNGRPLDGHSASAAIRRLGNIHMGVSINLHLARHTGIENYLASNPLGLPVAQRLLGHRNQWTTENLYGHKIALGGFQRHAELIEEIRSKKLSKPTANHGPKPQKPKADKRDTSKPEDK